jgi:hypothetical protein
MPHYIHYNEEVSITCVSSYVNLLIISNFKVHQMQGDYNVYSHLQNDGYRLHKKIELVPFLTITQP